MYMYMCTYIYIICMHTLTLRERGVSGCWAPLSLSRPQIVERLRLRVAGLRDPHNFLGQP